MNPSPASHRRALRLGRFMLFVVVPAALRVAAADLTLTVEPRWRHDVLTIPSTGLHNDAGQTHRITRLSALVSEVTLLRADGGSVVLDGQFGFVDAANGRLSFTLHGVPTGEYAGLEFQIGLPPEVNHGDPGKWAVGHALHPLNGLHWSWQGGYVFFALEGRWSPSSPAGAEGGFSYHLATDARRMPTGLHAPFRIEGDTEISLALDLARIVGPLAWSAESGSESTHSRPGDELATQLAASVSRAWFWLGASSVRSHRSSVMGSASEANSAESAATEEPSLSSGPTPLPFLVPAGFPQPALPADNPLTVEGVALGESLFFEPRLSRHGNLSCASCHAPDHAFSDSVALSLGDEGAIGVRNAMPLFNLAWSPSFAWDGSQPKIRDQARAAWVNPIEMHADPAGVVSELTSDAVLRDRFEAAFGSAGITSERIVLALEQFLLTQVSSDSRFDRALRGETGLTAEEKRGFELFATEFDPARGQFGADCFHCHGGMLFTDQAMRSNGLDWASADPGLAGVTARPTDAGKFKTPSLRNVALTAPYMHDGRFSTLEEVIAHYDHGVQRTATLDPNLAKHPAAGLSLSEPDQRALVAFLHTLTDLRSAD